MKPQERLTRRTAREIERFLKDRRAELQESMRSVLPQPSTHEGGQSADPIEGATERLHAEIQVALVNRQSRQAAQIEAALQRLAQGEYGICGDCGEFIGLARLRALPFARRCTPCQSRVELRAQRATRPVAAAVTT